MSFKHIPENIHSSTNPKSQQSFWEWTGERLPSFACAPSTLYYRRCEQDLLREHVRKLRGKRAFKTDLWDEAKNSQIWKWVAEAGVDVFGIDISLPIVQEAGKLFQETGVRAGLAVSDLRRISFASDTFDFLHSMGTIEHFKEYRQALAECYRVLKPGGTAVIGVPNKHDPFLRPLMVTVLNKMGLYAYGFEKSFTMRELETVLRDVGFRVTGRTGILFIPGWLRMLDIVLYIKWPKLSFVTRPCVSFFAYLYRKFPALRRQGYLIACTVQKPG